MVHRLPQTQINGIPYFVDERLRECRNVADPHDRIPFDGPGGYHEYRYWFNELQVFVGTKVTCVGLHLEDDQWYPELKLQDGYRVILLADEDGNGPGRFTIVEAP